MNDKRFILTTTIRCILFIIITASCLLMSGCGGRELDTLAIVTSIEVSNADEAGDSAGGCRMQAEIISMENSESESLPSNSISVTEGKDMEECIEKLEESESRKLYLGHLRIMIFDGNYLKVKGRDEMEKLADFAVNNTEIRFNTLLLTTDHTADGEVLNAETTATGNRGMDLSDELRLGGGKNIKSVEIIDIINQMYFGSSSISLPTITIKDMNGKKIAVIDQENRYEAEL